MINVESVSHQTIEEQSSDGDSQHRLIPPQPCQQMCSQPRIFGTYTPGFFSTILCVVDKSVFSAANLLDVLNKLVIFNRSRNN